MTSNEAIELLLEHVECKDMEEFMDKLVSEEIHNAAICVKCEEIFDVEPDASTGESPCCPGKRYYSLTRLFGIDI